MRANISHPVIFYYCKSCSTSEAVSETSVLKLQPHTKTHPHTQLHKNKHTLVKTNIVIMPHLNVHLFPIIFVTFKSFYLFILMWINYAHSPHTSANMRKKKANCAYANSAENYMAYQKVKSIVRRLLVKYQ